MSTKVSGLELYLCIMSAMTLHWVFVFSAAVSGHTGEFLLSNETRNRYTQLSSLLRRKRDPAYSGPCSSLSKNECFATLSSIKTNNVTAYDTQIRNGLKQPPWFARKELCLSPRKRSCCSSKSLR